MNHSSLLRLLDLLKKVKHTMHDTADVRTTKDIDRAIEIVTGLIDDSEKSKSPEPYKELLKLVGVIFDKAPAIAAVIKLLSG